VTHFSIVNLLKHINLRNFKTLYRAIWTESPQQIYTNFKKLVSGERQQIIQYTIVESSEEDLENDLPLAIEFAYKIANKYLFVYGWAAGIDIPDLSIHDDSQNLLWRGKPTIKRSDNLSAFPAKLFKRKTGFGFLVPVNTDSEKFYIKSSLDESKYVKYAFTCQSYSNINDAGISRVDQYKFIQSLKLAPTKKKILNHNPLISIVVPVYNVKPKWLKKMIASVESQSYTNWELCLCDDKSTKQKTIDCLKKFEKQDNIQVVWSKVNQNISLATNMAIDIAKGEFIGFLDHDDELHPDALYEVALKINEEPDLKVVYTDEDKITLEGNYIDPYHKSEFCLDTLRSNNFMSHFTVVQKKLGDKVGWLRKGYEGAQDHDLMLRLSEQTNSIYHIPKVLYHWRKIEGSTAMSHDQKGYAQKAGKKSISSHLERMGINASVKKGIWAGAYKVKYEFDKTKSLTIIIPFKDDVQMLKDCIRSLLAKTTYKNYNILLVSNNSQEEKTFKYLEEICTAHKHINYLEYNVPFNFSKINNWAVEQTSSEYILFLNNDITAINKGWLSEMAQHIQREEIGATGAKLLYPDGTIQHAGVVLGIGGVAGHAFKGLPGHASHYFMDNLIRGASACTAACLLVKREAFEKVNGFDQENLKVAFNDIDLCLKIREAGFNIIYTPYANLYHYESKSRGYEDTVEKIKRFKTEYYFMKDKWGEKLSRDPYYNPNFTNKYQQYQLDLQSHFNEYLEINAE